MKIKSLYEALKCILKNYKKEIEQSPNINIIEQIYATEEGSIRRQLIIDYEIPSYHQNHRNLQNLQNHYYI